MIKNKLFCKFIGIVCSISLISLFGVNNNFVGAESSSSIVNGIFRELPEREQSRLKKSLGFINYQELCGKIKDKFGSGAFSDCGVRFEDNVHFVCFIKFIASSRLDRKEKDQVISKALGKRSEEEHNNDIYIIERYQEIMGKCISGIFGIDGQDFIYDVSFLFL